jgi:hypothetical protein
MPNTLTITELRNDRSLTESDLDQMGTDGQVMLKTVITDEDDVVTSENIEFFNTLEEAEKAKIDRES